MEANLTNSKLTEGLRENDLRDLLIPLISIDEYESKIGAADEVLVMGFFVESEDGADDLSRFINRSANEKLDTDVSPAPTESGFFVVFVEIKRDANAYKAITAILDEIQNIVNIGEEEWTFKGYQTDEVRPFNETTFNEAVRIYQPTHESFKLVKFFDNALVENVQVDETKVSINGDTFQIHDFKALQESTFSVSFTDLAMARRLDTILGIHYNTSVLGETIQINNNARGETIYATLV